MFKTKAERSAAGEPVRDGPFDGLPGHLHSSLQAVLLSFAYEHGAFQPERVRRLERVTRVSGFLLGPSFDERNYRENVSRVVGDPALHLLDGVLEISGSETAQRVDRMLSEAGSIFRVVSRDFGTAHAVYALERRIPAQVDEAIALLRHAQEHLQSARSLVFGRSPDFTKGLHECVRALEAPSIPIAQPNNTKATLGHVIGEVRNNATKYAADRPATVELFVSLTDSLWLLQSPHRHGSPVERTPPPLTREETESAFWLTVTLSTWCERGHVRRV